ncbi:hypothetical protein GJAV_G00270700 [Gymnothorax javanicus]|nr:hypothetical protein GJAV_G00270700 [Gymnothorax javanicus]
MVMSLDAYWEQEVREEDLLSGLDSSKVGVPLRMEALQTLCGRLPWLEQQAREAWPRSKGIRSSVQWLYILEQPCRRLYPRETAKEDLTGSNQSDKKSIPKWKSPYFQQRQYRVNTARRPYILKRSGAD